MFLYLFHLDMNKDQVLEQFFFPFEKRGNLITWPKNVKKIWYKYYTPLSWFL